MNTHFCPICPVSFDHFDRLCLHFASHFVNAEEDVSDSEVMEVEIDQAIADDAEEEIRGNLIVRETAPACAAWSLEQNVLLRLMTLHRIGAVSRESILEMLSLCKTIASLDADITIRKMLNFERDFSANTFCLKPHHRFVESTSLGTTRTFKIGFIPIAMHIARAYRIEECSRKYQLWKENEQNFDDMKDLYDLPRFRQNPLMLEDRRNLLLIFYVDKVNRNRQVNLGWKNVWVLRCIPAQLSMQERADMENWWDLTFVPGFLLKEKGVNYFLDPFVEELLQLRTNGTRVFDALKREQFLCKADYFGIIGDLPAVANVVYFKEGGYSKLLRWCMHCFGLQGQTFDEPPRVNTKHSCVFVEFAKMNKLHDAENHAKFLGVNGCTSFWKLESFSTDTIFNDFFHTVLEGELKKLTNELFHSNARTSTGQVIQYSIFDQTELNMINMIMGSLPLRQDDERMVDFVRRHRFYSGHQMYLWLRVALPVLHEYLPKTECDCREGIRTQIDNDLLEYFDLDKTHQYWDHFVGIREFCVLYIRLTSHLGLKLSNETIANYKEHIKKIIRLNMHLYGSSFATIKTHTEACHSIDLMKFQGKPGWLQCFTPERDNHNIKRLNINSKDVFYHLLKLSEIQKSVHLCKASSNDSKAQARGGGLYKPFDRNFMEFITREYQRWNIQFPQEADTFAFISPNNSYSVSRLLYVLYYGAMYWIVAREYSTNGEPDPDVGLLKLYLEQNTILVPADKIAFQVIVLPKNLEYFVRNHQTFDTCGETQPYYWLCNEF